MSSTHRTTLHPHPSSPNSLVPSQSSDTQGSSPWERRQKMTAWHWSGPTHKPARTHTRHHAWQTSREEGKWGHGGGWEHSAVPPSLLTERARLVRAMRTGQKLVKPPWYISQGCSAARLGDQIKFLWEGWGLPLSTRQMIGFVWGGGDEHQTCVRFLRGNPITSPDSQACPCGFLL